VNAPNPTAFTLEIRAAGVPLGIRRGITQVGGRVALVVDGPRSRS
jgi:hypothetical protein